MPPLYRKVRKHRERPVSVTQPQPAPVRLRDFPWKFTFLVLAPLAFVALGLVVLFSLGGTSQKALFTKPVHAPKPAESGTPRPNFKEEPMPTEQLALKRSLADTEFRLKNYDEAEKLYCEIGPDSSPQGPVVFRIFTCMVLQGHTEEARRFFAGTDGSQPSPVTFYANGFLVLREGKPDKAREIFDRARKEYPGQCEPYDTTLRTIGYLP